MDWPPQSNERNLRKTRKMLQRKGCYFYCSKFDTLPVSCWFTDSFGTLLNWKFFVWKLANSALFASFVKASLPGWEAFKSKETPLCERNGNTFTFNSYYIYPCSCFHFIVNEIWRNKQKTTPDVWPQWNKWNLFPLWPSSQFNMKKRFLCNRIVISTTLDHRL